MGITRLCVSGILYLNTRTLFLPSFSAPVILSRMWLVWTECVRSWFFSNLFISAALGLIHRAVSLYIVACRWWWCPGILDLNAPIVIMQCLLFIERPYPIQMPRGCHGQPPRLPLSHFYTPLHIPPLFSSTSSEMMSKPHKEQAQLHNTNNNVKMDDN